MKYFLLPTLVLAGVGLARPAQAQGFPVQPQPFPFYPPVWQSGFGPGAVLNGQANLLQAQGQNTIMVEQARVEREKALQAKQDTRKRTFDQMMYEKANTPTFTENQEKINAMLLRRVMTMPSDAEVISGRSQNIILPFLRNLSLQGSQGPVVPIDQDMLKKINVSTGKSNTSLGPLQNGGHLDWPIILESKEQAKLADMLVTGVSQATVGKLDQKLFRQIRTSFDNVREEVRQKLHKNEIDGSDWLTAQRFLDPLEGAIRGLGQPGAGKFLNGTFAARGNTMQELVQNMSRQGLTFAPATAGNEAAYFALQSAMVEYANAHQNGQGFQVRIAPPAYTDKYAPFMAK